MRLDKLTTTLPPSNIIARSNRHDGSSRNVASGSGFNKFVSSSLATPDKAEMHLTKYARRTSGPISKSQCGIKRLAGHFIPAEFHDHINSELPLECNGMDGKWHGIFSVWPDAGGGSLGHLEPKQAHLYPGSAWLIRLKRSQGTSGGAAFG